MSASWQLQRKCLFFFLGLSKQTEKLSNLCEIFYCVSIIDLFVKCDTINSVSCLFPPKILVLVTQWGTTLCTLTDCSLPGSSVHEIFQARTLEWVAIPFSMGSSNLGIKPRSPALQADFFLLSEPLGKPCQYKMWVKQKTRRSY